jgi:hypothetical protein
MTDTLHEDVFMFMTISRRILIRIRNFSNKSCRENQNTHFTFNNFFFENCAIYEIMKNLMEPETLQMAIWRRVAYWTSKATHAQAHASASAPTPTPTHA